MTIHTVQKGDTLWKISKMHGISLEALIAANPQITNPDKIDVGMTINVPGGSMAPAVPEMQAPAPTTPVTEVVEDLAPTNLAPAPPVVPTPTAAPVPTPAPAAEMGFPSAAKWDGLWKYVVKNGDTMYKIAKQVGVTLDQLKAANPQVANPEMIYPNQVLNIPATGMKSKAVSPGQSLKEKLTSPMGMQPVDKEQLLKPKEMAPMEFTKPAAFVPPTPMMPIETPMPMPAPVPAPLMPGIDINANMQFAPHIDIDMSKKQWQLTAPTPQPIVMPIQHHHHVQPAPAPAPQVVSPAAAAPQYPMMMYIPVTVKKAKKKRCFKKKHKCGCHKKHHHYTAAHMHHDYMMMMYQQQMMQHMPGMTQGMQAQAAMMPRTFYHDEE